MRAFTSSQKAYKNAMWGNRSYVWLFDFHRDATDITRIAANQTDVTYEGQTYSHREVSAEGVSEDLAGTLADFRIVVGDADGILRTYWLAGKFSGYPVTARLVNLANLAAGEDSAFRGVIKDAQADDRGVAFVVGGEDLRSEFFPRETLCALHCRFRWKDWRCQYAGGVSTPCDGREETCDEVMSNAMRFGGAPAIPRFHP